MTCQTCFLVIFLLVNILGSHALMEDSVHSPNLLMLSSVERKDGWAAGTVSKSHRVLVISEVQESWRYGEYDWVVLRYGLVLVLGVKQTSRLFLLWSSAAAAFLRPPSNSIQVIILTLRWLFLATPHPRSGHPVPFVYTVA